METPFSIDMEVGGEGERDASSPQGPGVETCNKCDFCSSSSSHLSIGRSRHGGIKACEPVSMCNSQFYGPRLSIS